MKIKRMVKKWLLYLFSASIVVGIVSFDGNFHPGSDRVLAATTISAPATVHVKRAGNTALKLTWNEVDDAAGYEIYRHDSTKKTFKKVQVVSKKSIVKWTDKKLKRDSTYTYKLRAYRKVDGKIQYSRFTYTVSAITYTKSAAVVNAGVVKCQDTITLGIRQKVKIVAEVQPSTFGTAKKKKAVSRKTRLLLNKNSILAKDSEGNIIGRDVGTVNLYVMAHNGNMKTVRVTVVDYAKPTEWVNLDQVNSDIEMILMNQKDDITTIASHLSKNYTKSGVIRLDITDDGEDIFLSNKNNLDIDEIRDAIMRFIEVCNGCGYGAKFEVRSSYIDFSIIDTEEDGPTIIHTIRYSVSIDYGLYNYSVDIAPHWIYS